MARIFILILVTAFVLGSPAPAQSGYGGSSTTTLDADIWIDLFVGPGLDVFGSAPAGSSVTLYLISLSQFPFGPVASVGPLIASPGSNYQASFPLPTPFVAGPLVVAAVATTPSGAVQVSALQVLQVRVDPPCAAQRHGMLFVGDNASGAEVVRIKVFGCPGDEVVIKDPSGVVRASVTIPPAGGPVVFETANDHPGNANWKADIDSGNGLIPYLGN